MCMQLRALAHVYDPDGFKLDLDNLHVFPKFPILKTLFLMAAEEGQVRHVGMR